MGTADYGQPTDPLSSPSLSAWAGSVHSSLLAKLDETSHDALDHSNVPGAQGPPGGSVISGNWTYSTATTGPASTGEIRTSPELSSLSSSGTLWLSPTDANGLDWSAITVEVGNQFYLRSFTGETWVLDVDSVIGSGEFGVTIVSTTGTAPKRNETVQVSLVQSGADAGVTQAYVDAQDATKVNGAGITIWIGTEAEYAAVGVKDPNTAYLRKP